MGVVLLRDIWTNYNQVTPIPYNQFLDLLDSGEVSKVVVTQNHLRGELKNDLESGHSKFVTTRVDPKLADRLSESEVEFSAVVESGLLQELASWMIPVLIFVTIWLLIFRRMQKGGIGGHLMSIGKSKAKVYVEDDTKVKFSDVAGVDEAKTELIEIVEFLKDQSKFTKLGARIPKGVLLVGPPGTGKTLIAKAVAGEAGVPFFSISGPEFVEMFVGVGAARVRDLFEQARNKSPCIIFIDELDAVGRARGSGVSGGGHDEKEQTLNQLLVELDGFDSSSGIVLLAATNRPEILDPALLRSGRFDRQVLVDRPDKNGRLEILQVHVKKVVLSDTVELEQVAALTPGFTGADLANLVNEAALMATRRNAKTVDLEDFTGAIERIIAGLEKKNRLLNPKERDIVAHHEMGHALVAASLKGSDPVHKVSIIPRGIGSLGYTIQRPLDDRYLMTERELQNKMAVLMGGRAAEKIIFDHLSTGAADDIKKATNIARDMVATYGMDHDLGNVAYESRTANFLGQPAGMAGSRDYSEDSANKIDHSVRRLVEAAFDQALSILKTNLDLLKESSQKLLDLETLSTEDLEGIFAKIAAVQE